jgi:phage FluMu gp28-like protein
MSPLELSTPIEPSRDAAPDDGPTPELFASPNWAGDGLYFLPYQRRWLADKSPLKIIEKSRQIGLTSATAFSAVRRTAVQDARHDVFVSSRDEMQARLFLEDARRWAGALHIGARDLGAELLPDHPRGGAGVLELSNGRRIYSLASTPNALAGKRGHVILDEFALHANQRELFRVAKPVTTWGGQLEIISTHRGTKSVFNEIIRGITEQGNPMGWSHHKVTLQDAVNEGLVERLNEKTGRFESREDFMRRTRAECLDEAQWQEEFCCQPADETTAFLTYEMVHACEADCLWPNLQSALCNPLGPLFLGMDTGRKHDLTVIDVGEQIGDVIWDRLRLELANKTFAEQEFELFQILALPGLRRACIDATGLGMQLAERARQRFGWKVEPVTFTAGAKEEMAYALRTAFEDRRVRIPSDNKLISDLLGIKREVTSSGSLRFAGESGDSHCDRFWAKALRQRAATTTRGIQATVG